MTEVPNNDGPLPMQAEEWKIKHDHTYVTFPTYEDDNFNATSPLHGVEVTNINDNVDGASDDESGSNYVDDYDEDLDPSWQLPDDNNLPSDDEFEGNSNTPDCEKKFLVFDLCLSTVLKRCPECGDVIAQCDRKTTGSMLSVQLTYHSDHMINWDSQPVVKRKPLGNLLLEASILFTGNTFAAINRLASCLNLQFFSESVFYDTQQKYLFPVINDAWEAEKQRQLDILNAKEVVNLDGDAHCDSPGHSAKYETYTLMDDDTGDVVAFSVIQVSEVTSSNAMEKEGFYRCIQLPAMMLPSAGL